MTRLIDPVFKTKYKTTEFSGKLIAFLIRRGIISARHASLYIIFNQIVFSPILINTVTISVARITRFHVGSLRQKKRA